MKNDLIEKLQLIYEFDNDSPLFARVAHHYLESKDITKAEEVLEHGLSLYPDYPTAHIVMGKVALVKGEYDKAKEHFLTASNLLNSSETLVYYNNKIESIISKEEELKESTRTPFFDEEIFNTALDENLADEQIEELQDNDELEKLAKEIRKAKIPKQNLIHDEQEDFNFEFKNKEIVSETLAGIYFAQGNFNEAIDMYQKLIKIHPEKEMIFNAKILEIKTILEKKD